PPCPASGWPRARRSRAWWAAPELEAAHHARDRLARGHPDAGRAEAHDLLPDLVLPQDGRACPRADRWRGRAARADRELPGHAHGVDLHLERVEAVRITG